MLGNGVMSVVGEKLCEIRFLKSKESHTYNIGQRLVASRVRTSSGFEEEAVKFRACMLFY